MKLPLKLALALVVSLQAWTARGGTLGGEDFPFFCQTSGAILRSFELTPDSRSQTGFSIVFNTRYGWSARMPVWVEESRDGRHLVISGRQHAPAQVYDRHFKAYIARAPGVRSSSEMRFSARGRRPLFGGRLRPAICETPRG